MDDAYLDRDFSDAYSWFYSKLFKRHVKLCQRILFFRTDLASLVSETDVLTVAAQLSQVAEGFLGYLILRPISQAPISQALLRVPDPPADFEGELLVQAPYPAHILGAELVADGCPMTQQDSRVGACAQAAIWTAARHFHVKHRGPWLSTVSITQAATLQSEAYVNRALPAGSEFLTLNSMVAALRAANRETLIYLPTIRPGQAAVWPPHLRPVDIIDRYIDSGLPVILGLHVSTAEIGHAVAATGHVLAQHPTVPIPNKPSRAVFCEAFYVNDDQLGPNLRMAIRPGSAISEHRYNIQDNLLYLMVPLPGKVYLPAEVAEEIAWGVLSRHAADWPTHKQLYQNALGSSATIGDTLVTEFQANTILARTYLSYGWTYKHRAIRNRHPNDVKSTIRDVNLPRFVYVVEFSTLASLSLPNALDRRVISHAVIDATAKNAGLDSVLIFHAPGMIWWHEHDQTNRLVQDLRPVQDDTSYFPKNDKDRGFAQAYANVVP